MELKLLLLLEDQLILLKQYNVLCYYKENLKKEENKRTIINIVTDMYKYIQDTDEKFLKITICDDSKAIFNSIIRKLRNIGEIEVLDVSHISRKVIKQGTEDITIEYYYTEISLKDVDKCNAIEYLSEKLNIKKEEIITIGDNINDKKMIQNAGIGIVMEGSTPTVIKEADYVTNSNNEEGVAKAIEKFCF